MSAPAYAGFPSNPRHQSSNNFWQRLSPATDKPYQRGFHGGDDLKARTAGVAGDPIVPAYVGVVVGIGNVWGSSYGQQVLVRHRYSHRHRRSDGSSYHHTHDWWTFYAHLRRITCRRGQSVTTRTKLGEMGRTGSVTAVHTHHELHLEATWRGSPRDPFTRLETRRIYAIKHGLAH